MNRKRGFKGLALLLALVMTAALTGCAVTAPAPAPAPTAPAAPQPVPAPVSAQKIEIQVGTLKGPTGMGMVKLMADAEAGTTASDYQFDILGAPEEMVGKVTTGEVDIAALPVNLAATLYQKTGNVQIAAVNTLGVLYILDRSGAVNTLADLKGKTLYASGKGSSPEFVLNYILKKSGIDPAKDLTIEYKTEHTELATLLLTKKAEVALLPEPFVTTVTSKDASVARKIDLTKEWASAAGGNAPLAMGCIIVNSAFAKENPGAVQAFLDEYKASVDFVNGQPKEAGELIAKYGIMDNAALAEKAIPGSNIVYLDGADMEAGVKTFLEVLFAAEPKSVGGKLPDEGFYYQK